MADGAEHLELERKALERARAAGSGPAAARTAGVREQPRRSKPWCSPTSSGRTCPRSTIFSIDTGRLHEETYALLERLQRRYQRRMRVVYPRRRRCWNGWSPAQGINGFYRSLEARLELLPRAQGRAVPARHRGVHGVDHRRAARAVHAGAPQGTADRVGRRARPVQDQPAARLERGGGVAVHPRAQLPYNPLHDRQFPSIGCAPCTRAIQPGEARRAGRWWWEHPKSRECGLHPRHPRRGRRAPLKAEGDHMDYLPVFLRVQRSRCWSSAAARWRCARPRACCRPARRSPWSRRSCAHRWRHAWPAAD